MIYPRLVGLLTFVMLLAGCAVPNVQTLTQPIPADTSQVDTTPDGDTTRSSATGQRADLLSAFFGLDDDLPGTANLRICGVWQGGITKPNGDEVDDVERMQYTVTLDQNGSPVDTVPFALGDLDDGDNNHLLCLSEEGTPQSISFSAGYVVDPKGDLNPATAVEVQPFSSQSDE